MEDILNNHSHEQQHRSSSFSDEKQQQKLSIQQDKHLKRISDGALIDFHRKTNSNNNNRNEYVYPTTNHHQQQQQRSFNDLANKHSTRGICLALNFKNT